MHQPIESQRQPAIPVAWVVAALALAMALVAVTWGFARQAGDSGQDRAETQQLLSRLDALERRAQGHSLRGGNGGFPAAPISVAERSPLGSSGKGESPQMTSAQVEVQTRAQLRSFESRFSQEARDPAAPQIELNMLTTMVDSQLGTSGILPKNPDVDCKRDTCRIVADFRSASDASDWAVLYLTVLGADYVGSAQPLFVNQADGSTQMRMFASRKPSTSRSPGAVRTND